MHALARLGIVPGTLPLSHVLKQRAVLDVPVVHWGCPRYVEEITRFPPSNRTKGGWRVRGAEGGGADIGNGHAQNVGENAKRVDVRGLALIRRHAQRGVALDVLHRAEVLTHGQFKVGGGYVVLEINPKLAALFGRLVRG